MKRLILAIMTIMLTACNAGQGQQADISTPATTVYTHITNGEVLTLDDNGTAGYALYGTTTITRDAGGLADAMAMRVTLDLVIADLQHTTQH